MAARGLVRVVLEATGGSRVRAALRGTVADSRRADREISSSARRAAQERTRAEREAARAAATAARTRQREEVAAQRAIARAAAAASREEQRTIRATERAFRASMRERRREAEATARALGFSGRAGARGAVMSAGAGALAAGSSALGTVRGYASELGVPDRATMVRSFIEAQQSFLRTANFAGISDERRDAITSSVGDIARRTNVGPAALFDALNRAQDTFATADFAALDYFADNLESIARASQATGAPVEDMVGAIGELQRQLHVTSEEVPDVIGALVAGMAGGSLTAGDVAANFSRNMDQFTTIRGEAGRGESGAREFLAMAQALGGAGRGAEGASTLMENLFSALSRRDVRRAIEGREGLNDRNIFDANGRLAISFGELFERMAASPTFTTPEGLENVTHDAQARAAILALTGEGGTAVSGLMNVSSEEGNALIDSTMSDLMNSDSGRAMNLGVAAEASFLGNGGEVVRLMTEMTAPLVALTNEYPRATMALEGLGEMARNVAGALMGMAILNGTNAAAAGAAGAGGAAAAGGLGAIGRAAAMAPLVGGAIMGAEALGDWGNRSAMRTGERGGEAIGFLDSLNSPEMRSFLGLFRNAGMPEVPARLREGAAGAPAAPDAGRPATVTIDPASVRAIGDATRTGAATGVSTGTARGAPPASARAPGEPGRRG